MAGKILLINQDQAMMVNRLAALLKEAKIETAIVGPVIRQIEREKDNVSILVLFTGDFVYDAQDFLESLKEICLDIEKPLCLVGFDKEFAKVAESIPRNMIVRCFTRPFDVKTLSANLAALLSAEDAPVTEKQILLVDDDFTFLQMVKSWLGVKYNVAVARSGMQAISYLAEHTADLILLDYEMPIMPGPQVLEALRSEPRCASIPVIFLTGKSVCPYFFLFFNNI